MRRQFVFGALMVALVASLAAPRAQDREKVVEIQSLSAYDTLYSFTGGGGNSLALMRDDGVVLIDTKMPGWAPPLLASIQLVSDRPVTTIINTHANADRVVGNIEIPTATRIIAHENTRGHMQRMAAFAGGNAKFLPNTIVTDRMSLFEGSDRLDLYYFGAGHTNGDLVVVFPEKRTAYLGDLFPGKVAPIIDTANGGSGVELPRTLAKIVAEIKGVRSVVAGHQPVKTGYYGVAKPGATMPSPVMMTWKDVEEYADFTRDFLASVQSARKAGSTVDQAAMRLELPDRYKSYDLLHAREAVEAIYAELASKGL